MAKRKKKKKSKRSLAQTEKILQYLIWVLSIIAVILLLFIGGYFLGYNTAKEDLSSKMAQKEHQRKKALAKLEKTIHQKQSLHKQLQDVLHKAQHKVAPTAAHEIDTKAPIKPVQKEIIHQKSKPKLAIIFDDVSTASQVRAIHHLGLKVTLSFFPPSPSHPNTPKLAQKEQFYMVHLPMEALHFHKEEPFTLHVYDSFETIQKRITKIKQLFPKVRYINNHTGSKFTSNLQAVRNLLTVLEQNDITFIDSRTTAKTKVPQVEKERQHRYLARDVFLDHNGDIASIKKQIALAVKLTKKYGNIIAIGHPHPNTIKALAQSKHILKQVDLVYVYQLH